MTDYIRCDCPRCGKECHWKPENIGTNGRCDGCGMVFPIKPVSQSRSVSSNPALRPCPDCGEPVSIRAAACPRCGCPINAPKEDQRPVVVAKEGLYLRMKNIETAFKIIVAIVSVIVILVLIATSKK